MNIRTSLSIFFCFLSTLVFSQNELSGKLTDLNNDPLAYANVILLNAQDSVSVVKGTVSEEDGSFLLKDIKDDNYVLKITYVGYEDLLKKIRVKGDTNLKTLKVSPS